MNRLRLRSDSWGGRLCCCCCFRLCLFCRYRNSSIVDCRRFSSRRKKAVSMVFLERFSCLSDEWSEEEVVVVDDSDSDSDSNSVSSS